jgi:outer membrane immunogenic protein
MKNRLLLSLAAIAALPALSASAADLPSHKAAPVYAPPVQTWTGFYAGLNAGYNVGTNADAGMENYAGMWTTKPGGGNVLYQMGDGVMGIWMPPGMAVYPNGPLGTSKTIPLGSRYNVIVVTLPGSFYGGGNVATTLGSSGGGGGLLGAGGYDRNTQSGFIGGGQIGYNYQYGSSIVLGIETDIQGTGIRGTTTGSSASQTILRTPLPAVETPPRSAAPNAGTITSGVSAVAVQGGVDWLGTVRGRLGYLVTPTLLLYGSGGLAYGNAWANVEQTSIENHFATADLSLYPGYLNETSTWLGGGRQNQILTGWTAGGGIEWMFMQNWSLKAEALYWDLGRMNVETVAYGVTGKPSEFSNNIGWGRTSVSYSGVQAKAGINYHFNWGAAPVVAKY